MEDRGNIWMTETRCRPGFAQKTKPRRLITEISLADEFQCHGASQIDVERLISDTHCAPTQLDRFPVLIGHEFVVFQATRYRCRLAGVTLPAESLAQQGTPDSISLLQKTPCLKASGDPIPMTAGKTASFFSARHALAGQLELGT